MYGRPLTLLALTVMAATPVWAADAEVSATATTLEGKGTVAVAPTQAEAEAAFRAARRGFMAVAHGGADHREGDIDDAADGSVSDAVAGGQPENVALEDIRVVMDLENVTLREVMVAIAKQAAVYTGPWTVKWRLKPENTSLMDLRVNLTVEAPFGQFCALLTERVKNMTGTQLFVTAFESSRILLVTDTYY